MPRRVIQIAALSLLALYGAMAVLGHGGMHAVQDAAGVPHSHGGHPVACSHDDGAADAHRHCCHDHSHRHAHAVDAHAHDDHDHGSDHGPAHDPDDCVVCHYFATAAVQRSDAPEIAGTLLASASPLSRVLEPAGADRFVQPIRGPPAPRC